MCIVVYMMDVTRLSKVCHTETFRRILNNGSVGNIS